MDELSMPALPEGYTARPPIPEDLGAVADVVQADEEATRGEFDTTLEDLESEWRQPSFFPHLHARVVLHDGQLVAYGEQVHARIAINVAPEHHGRGLGGALLDWTVLSARREGHAQVGQTVPDVNAEATALVRDRGFRVRWETWLLGRDLEVDEPVPAPPEGYELRPLVKEADVKGVHNVIETAFSGWPDRDPPMPFADWRTAFYDRADVTEQHSSVITHDGEVVGALLGLVDRGEGLVEQLGVHPDHQGRGLGEVLLRSAFASFAAADLPRVVLVTESRTGARDFYERAGLTVERSFTRWTLPLS